METVLDRGFVDDEIAENHGELPLAGPVLLSLLALHLGVKKARLLGEDLARIMLDPATLAGRPTAGLEGPPVAAYEITSTPVGIGKLTRVNRAAPTAPVSTTAPSAS